MPVSRTLRFLATTILVETQYILVPAISGAAVSFLYNRWTDTNASGKDPLTFFDAAYRPSPDSNSSSITESLLPIIEVNVKIPRGDSPKPY